MYAALCLKLSRTHFEVEANTEKKGKMFKKLLLTRCQEEFETDTAQKIAKATEGITEEEEIEFKTALVKRHYLGHMRFIGELYKGDLISIKIMLFVLPALLEGESSFSGATGEKKDSDSDDIDEEKVECFTKLMTTIGSSLEQQSAAMKDVGKADASDKLADCWVKVQRLAGVKKGRDVTAVSNRIKFMLQDLLEMRDKGWVTRRKEETAKTIAQIHKEVEKEERAAARRSNSSANLRRMHSAGEARGRNSGSQRPSVDKDGFQSVSGGKGGPFSRSVSMGNMPRSSSRGSMSSPGKQFRSTKGAPSGKFAALMESPSVESKSPEKVQKAPPKAKSEHKSPSECGDKAKNYIKEYFVGGDADDAVLSFHELICIGEDGSVERGAKMVESAVLLVLEMKRENVDKLLTIILRLISEKKIDSKSLEKGLNDPLEFLSDITIDAPLAGDLLANIVASFVKSGAITLDFILNAPDYFRTDGKAAQFTAKVLKIMGEAAVGDAANVDVVGKLMTNSDKENYGSAKDLIAAC